MGFDRWGGRSCVSFLGPPMAAAAGPPWPGSRGALGVSPGCVAAPGFIRADHELDAGWFECFARSLVRSTRRATAVLHVVSFEAHRVASRAGRPQCHIPGRGCSAMRASLTSRATPCRPRTAPVGRGADRRCLFIGVAYVCGVPFRAPSSPAHGPDPFQGPLAARRPSSWPHSTCLCVVRSADGGARQRLATSAHARSSPHEIQ